MGNVQRLTSLEMLMNEETGFSLKINGDEYKFVKSFSFHNEHCKEGTEYFGMEYMVFDIVYDDMEFDETRTRIIKIKGENVKKSFVTIPGGKIEMSISMKADDRMYTFYER